MLDQLIERRRALHQIPELGFDLPKTQAYLLEQTAAWGVPVETVAGCGLAAYFDFGCRETALFRSDMDALPVEEPPGCPFASRHPGRMHACGHDGHMAMLLALGDQLAQGGEAPRNALLVFQPAEESGGGGREIAHSGLLERRRVSRAYALHVEPMLPAGVLSSRPGPFMARSSEVHLKVTGRSAHAARSAEGLDALQAAARFVSLAADREQEMDPAIPRLLKFGLLKSGTAVNIIAGEALVGGTLRTFDPQVFQDMSRMLAQCAQAVEARYGVRASLMIDAGYPALINDPDLYREARQLLSGFSLVQAPQPSLLAEDFSFYGERLPILMFHLGLGTGHPLHAREFAIDESALAVGAQALIRLARGR